MVTTAAGFTDAAGTVTVFEAEASAMKVSAAADSVAGKGFMAGMDSMVAVNFVGARDSTEVEDSMAAEATVAMVDIAKGESLSN